MVAAAIRTIFAQPDAEAVHEQLHSIAQKLGRRFPVVEQMLIDAAPDITAFAAFPRATGVERPGVVGGVFSCVQVVLPGRPAPTGKAGWTARRAPKGRRGPLRIPAS